MEIQEIRDSSKIETYRKTKWNTLVYNEEYVEWLEMQLVKNLHIPDVRHSLPDGWWYSDENGREVEVIGVFKNWAVVSSIVTEDTWLEPLEFVMNLYEECKGNDT